MGDDGFALTLGDGRRLEGWANDGSGTGALLLHVGTPMAGLPHAPLVAAASGHRLRFVTYSRPGYGTSTPHAGTRRWAYTGSSSSWRASTTPRSTA